MNINSNNYDYNGRLVSVKYFFTSQIGSSIKLYAAVSYSFTGECLVAEWRSLKSRPSSILYTEWIEEHLPIEYLGPKLANILRHNGYKTMRAIYEAGDVTDIKGIGANNQTKITQAALKWHEDFNKGRTLI